MKPLPPFLILSPQDVDACCTIARVMATYHDGKSFEVVDLEEFIAYKEMAGRIDHEVVYWSVKSFFHLYRWRAEKNKSTKQ